MTGTIVTLTKYEDSEEMGDRRYEERKQIRIAADMILVEKEGRGRAENEQNRSGTVEEEQKTNKTDQGQVISEFYRDSIEDWVNLYG